MKRFFQKLNKSNRKRYILTILIGLAILSFICFMPSQARADSLLNPIYQLQKGVQGIKDVFNNTSLNPITGMQQGWDTATQGQEGLAGSIAGILGWVILPIIQLLGNLLGVLIRLMVHVAQYNHFITSPAVSKGWLLVRDTVNMFFVVILLVIAFSTVLRIEKYSYKRLLGSLLLAAILVNFSKLICGFLIDISQVVMLTFVNAFKDAAEGNFAEMLGLKHMMSMRKDLGDASISGISLLGSLILALIMTIVALVVILVILVILIGRIITLWFLVLLSPLVFVFNLLPQTQRYTSMWWEKFTNQLIVGPVLAFFLWLSLAIVQDHGDQMFTTVIDKDGEAYNSIATNLGGSVQGETGLAAGVAEIGQPQYVLNFVIGIAMLIGSLMAAQQLGVAGSGMAGKAIGKFKGVASGAAAAPWRGTKAFGRFMGVPQAAKELTQRGLGKIKLSDTDRSIRRIKKEGRIASFFGGKKGAKILAEQRIEVMLKKDLEEKNGSLKDMSTNKLDYLKKTTSNKVLKHVIDKERFRREEQSPYETSGRGTALMDKIRNSSGYQTEKTKVETLVVQGELSETEASNLLGIAANKEMKNKENQEELKRIAELSEIEGGVAKDWFKMNFKADNDGDFRATTLEEQDDRLSRVSNKYSNLNSKGINNLKDFAFDVEGFKSVAAQELLVMSIKGISGATEKRQDKIADNLMIVAGSKKGFHKGQNTDAYKKLEEMKNADGLDSKVKAKITKFFDSTPSPITPPSDDSGPDSPPPSSSDSSLGAPDSSKSPSSAPQWASSKSLSGEQLDSSYSPPPLSPEQEDKLDKGTTDRMRIDPNVNVMLDEVQNIDIDFNKTDKAAEINKNKEIINKIDNIIGVIGATQNLASKGIGLDGNVGENTQWAKYSQKLEDVNTEIGKGISDKRLQGTIKEDLHNIIKEMSETIKEEISEEEVSKKMPKKKMP